MQSTGSIYLNRIDILRFVAASLVIFWHFSHYCLVVPFNYVSRFFPLSILLEGHTGVSLFMVVSGFIFQYINAGKDIDYASFLRNRVIRILPLAIFWILILVTIDKLNTVESLLNTFFVFNSRSVPGVGWTIVVEFQFYLMFPVFHKVLEKKDGIKNLLGLIIMLGMVRYVLFVNNIDNIRDFAYYTIFGRLDQFLIGMIAAKLYLDNKDHRFFASASSEFLRLGALAATLTVIFVFFYLFNLTGGLQNSISSHMKSYMWLGFHDAEAVMYGTMIVLFLSINKYNFLALPEKVFSKFGEFSYSMYWVHFPVIKALCVLMRAHGILWPGPFSHVFIAWGIIIMPCIVILSGFSYTFFEKPFLQFRHKYN